MTMDLKENDRVEMKKPHPCGGRIWLVVRAGADVRLRCTGCGRMAELPRAKAEKAIKKVLREEEL